MIPWELIEAVDVPDGGGELSLYRRGEEYSIRIGHSELMNSRVHGSEDALSELACARIAAVKSPNVLIGGLGMGYTVAAALKVMPQKSQVVVAELSAAVIGWNRVTLAHLARFPLKDKRVKVFKCDVVRLIEDGRATYDAILLDVDNGPEGLSRKENDQLYGLAGLKAAYRALRPLGVLAVWSAVPNKNFTRRLKQAGFAVAEHKVSARGPIKSGGHHIIWIAARGE